MAWKPSKERKPLRVGHLLWGLACLVLMAWGFVLGLWVGQGSLATPEQIAGVRAWARYLPGLGKTEPTPAEAPTDKQALAPPELTFYTNLEKGVAPAPEPAPVRMAVKATETPAAKPPEPRPAPPAALTSEPKPFVPNPPAGQPAGRPVMPATLPPTANRTQLPATLAPLPRPAPGATQSQPKGGRFTVQVASFKEEEQARELLSQLRAGGHPAYVVPVRLEGVGTRYRVRVGPFYDFDVAQGTASRIRIQLTLAAYVTRED